MFHEFPKEGELPRKDRVRLAVVMYGLYLIGQASNDLERIDEDCAMDNSQIPRRYEELNDLQRYVITGGHPYDMNRHKVVGGDPAMAALFEKKD